jgi:hypothetical protein
MIRISHNVLRTICLAGALCGTVYAQPPTDPTSPVDRGDRVTRVRDGGNYGWIGLFGLAGLLGLRRGDRDVRTTNMRTTEPRGI